MWRKHSALIIITSKARKSRRGETRVWWGVGGAEEQNYRPAFNINRCKGDDKTLANKAMCPSAIKPCAHERQSHMYNMSNKAMCVV